MQFQFGSIYARFSFFPSNLLSVEVAANLKGFCQQFSTFYHNSLHLSTHFEKFYVLTLLYFIATLTLLHFSQIISISDIHHVIFLPSLPTSLPPFASLSTLFRFYLSTLYIRKIFINYLSSCRAARSFSCCPCISCSIFCFP